MELSTRKAEVVTLDSEALCWVMWHSMVVVRVYIATRELGYTALSIRDIYSHPPDASMETSIPLPCAHTPPPPWWCKMPNLVQITVIGVHNYLIIRPEG